MSRTLFSITPVKNEADRYLSSMLDYVIGQVDHTFVFDDRSTDGTHGILKGSACRWRERPEGVPHFLEHEGKYRQHVWWAFEETCSPSPGDWVLAIDADELLVGAGEAGAHLCSRSEIELAIDTAEAGGAKSVLLPVPEVFGIDGDGTPLVRTDGLWGTIAGTRLFRYEAGGKFQNRPMGCGSEPTYVAAGLISRQAFGLRLMHFGYADKADQIAKHRRYTNLAAHGHADAHVRSIVSVPTLERFPAPALERRRGNGQN